MDRIESVVLYSFGWERTYCGEVEGTKPAQTILDRGVFLRSRAEAPYFIGTVSSVS